MICEEEWEKLTENMSGTGERRPRVRQASFSQSPLCSHYVQWLNSSTAAMSFRSKVCSAFYVAL